MGVGIGIRPLSGADILAPLTLQDSSTCYRYSFKNYSALRCITRTVNGAFSKESLQRYDMYVVKQKRFGTIIILKKAAYILNFSKSFP